MAGEEVALSALMLPVCPYIYSHVDPTSEIRNIVRNGIYRRKSDCRLIRRFHCRDCGKFFFSATISENFGQKKRQLNGKIRKFCSSSMTQRRMAKCLNTTRTTVARKLRHLGASAMLKLNQLNADAKQIATLEFDDMETFEHTKYKPLSITIAVEYKTRRLVGFEISRMPAHGTIAKRSIKKYGPRPDERRSARHKLFKRIQDSFSENAVIKSDQNPHYMNDVKKFFPNAEHQRFKGRKPCGYGYDELKEGVFDPLFSFNHTAAMIRHCLSRMARKTWTTTKSIQGLKDHLAIYMHYHNTELI